jgi:hypothetical protein
MRICKRSRALLPIPNRRYVITLPRHRLALAVEFAAAFELAVAFDFAFDLVAAAIRFRRALLNSPVNLV